MMQLNRVLLTRPQYGKNEGRLTGSLEVTGITGKIELILTEEQAQSIVAVVADQLVAYTKDIAATMTAEILTARPEVEQIEHGES
jgi:hypothetical protein